MDLNFSIIITVYQREDELTELLESLSNQTDGNFEVVIVDDGSPEKLESIVKQFSSKLTVKYFYKPNSGPGKSRNYGMERASGDYFIFLDSDTIIPSTYIETVRKELSVNYVDAFGGPDSASDSFSDLQKAISFSMTSFLTTGGIRGGKKHIGKFQPRSFNMGISKLAFEKTGGFGDLRIGEDPDLSMRLWENDFETSLFLNAKVFHKRRTNLKKFIQQVYQFGVARPILNRRHPNYTKPTFWLPSLFFICFSFCILSLFASLILPEELIGFLSLRFSLLFFIPLFLYFLLISILSSYQFKSFKIGILSILTTFFQFMGYGYGFLKSWVYLNVFRQNPVSIFPSHFYK